MAEQSSTEPTRKPQPQRVIPRGAVAARPQASSAPPKRKRKRTGLYIGIAFALIVVVGLGWLLSQMGKGVAPIEVETEKVTRHSITQTVTASGVVDPQTQVKISPEVSGEITYIGVEEGQRVTRGQVLVRISPASFSAERDEARAAIDQAKARQAQTLAQRLRAEADRDRTQQLFDRTLSSKQELETAQSQVRIAQAEETAARYAVQQAQASYRRITESLNKTTITAPISGVVTKLNSKVGEKVVGAIQMSGTEIMTIADLGVIEAVVDVSENDVVQVSIGDVAEVEVDAIPGQKFKATVSRIANSPKQQGLSSAEQVTNFEVRLRFDNPDERFRPGMTATATIETDKRANVLAVPIQSVTTRSEQVKRDEGDESDVRNTTLERARSTAQDRPKPVVFVRVGDSVAMRPVETGLRDNQYIEITKGLREGEVVISGTYKAISKDLQAGSKVKDAPKMQQGAARKPGGGA